jgi:hypothetical protein
MRAMRSAIAAAVLALLVPGAGDAAISHFGSTLNARASLSTNDLDYKGIDTPYGNGVVHTAHFGADTALWNTAIAKRSPPRRQRGR